MQSTAIFSPRDLQGKTPDEAGKAELCHLAAEYPYFLPLKVLCSLLENKEAALRELPYIYGVNPVVLHYVLAAPKAAPVVQEVPKIVGWKSTGSGETPIAAAADAPVAETTSVEVEQEAATQPEVEVEIPQISGNVAAETPQAEDAETLVEPVVEKEEETEAGVETAVETETAESPEIPETLIVQEISESAVDSTEPAPETAEAPKPEVVAKEPLPIAAAEADKPANPEEESVIQPLFTKDYFKHQGVSVTTKEHPFEFKRPSGNDLMVMRSFAEWLRFFHSKKTKSDEEVEDKRALKAMWQKGKLAAAMEEEDEEIPEVVFEMAVKSISHEGNPTTETMAKIYLGQGKWEKAIGVYEQLQLRNPQKSTYFAEKIAAIEQQHRP